MRASRDDSTDVMTPISSGAFPRTPPQRRTDDRLVGRRAKLARLGAVIVGLHAEGPKAVEIVEDPGIGKTRLLFAAAGEHQRALDELSLAEPLLNAVNSRPAVATAVTLSAQ